MLLHYCFWSHITFPSASLGVLERKLKELQQTVILHLLPGCSTPASLSPKGCTSRLGSQTQRRKSIHKTLHALISSLLPQQTSSPQQWSSSAAACQSLDRTKQFLRNAVFQILFQGESGSVLCLRCLSTGTPSQAPDPATQGRHGNSLSENREHRMIKGACQELFAPFLTLPASFSSSVVWVRILSKPALAESLCQFLPAPSSYCGLGASTRKINTFINSAAAALRRCLCLLWALKFPQATWRPEVLAEWRQLCHPHPSCPAQAGASQKSDFTRCTSFRKQEYSRVTFSRTVTNTPQGFIARKAKANFNSLLPSMGWTMDLELHWCLSSTSSDTSG